MRLAKFFGETFVMATQFGDFGLSIVADFGTAPLGKDHVNAGGALMPPGSQMRRVQTLAPQ